MIKVHDDVLPDPKAYREAALALEYRDVTLGGQTFKGIAPAPSVRKDSPPFFLSASASVTFFRKSPLGQEEPNYIHSDKEMGRQTGILFLNPDPPINDGTSFWASPKGKIRGEWSESIAKSVRPGGGWHAWHQVPARFNRLVIFDADLFHSRTIFDNYGEGDEARLIQVMFL